MVVQSRLNYITLGIANRTIGQIHGRIRKLADQQAQNVMLRELINLISEFEALDNILHILRKTVQVENKVGFQLLLIGAGFKIRQSIGGAVAKSFSRYAAQSFVLVGNTGSI